MGKIGSYQAYAGKVVVPRSNSAWRQVPYIYELFPCPVALWLIVQEVLIGYI